MASEGLDTIQFFLCNHANSPEAAAHNRVYCPVCKEVIVASKGGSKGWDELIRHENKHLAAMGGKFYPRANTCYPDGADKSALSILKTLALVGARKESKRLEEEWDKHWADRAAESERNGREWSARDTEKREEKQLAEEAFQQERLLENSVGYLPSGEAQ